eukprot:CAMPEP_0117687824 /NCGR_PEP_ID=MMETSP0804-20121206/23392_1 /TAXON_ID=1074897 /ORGANISM="Tetraselmis astigmatica, Strain CCMP880" /LENGTH=228 /DNA_ID=CAMNT_0005500015 /DNA_START=401 /DNA_END=1087 /DNA_ORIENTATION=+
MSAPDWLGSPFFACLVRRRQAADSPYTRPSQLARVSDFGVNDTIYVAKTHLGRVLKPGDNAWGYDMANMNICDPEMLKHLDTKAGNQVPEVVLVRKSYEDKRKRRKIKGFQRPWTLKRMDIEVADDPVLGRGTKARMAADQLEADRERFLEELEEDPEMRKGVALYRDPKFFPVAAANRMQDGMDEEYDDEEGVPEVPLEELLDNLEALGIDGDDAQQQDEGDDIMED